MAYTGPVPPTPTASSTDAQWTSWWAYENAARCGRYDDERAARYVIDDARKVVLDAQHREKMAAEAACAAATNAQAAAMQAVAAAARAPQPAWTEEELVRGLTVGLAEAGITGARAVILARATMLSFGDYYAIPKPPPLPLPPAPPKTTAESELSLSGPPGEQSLPPAKKPQELP